MFLTPHELRELTGKERPTAQARALDAMGLPYRKRPDGTLAVLKAHIEYLPPHQEPRLRA